MTLQKLGELFRFYKETLGAVPFQSYEHQQWDNHLCWMCDRALEEYIPNRRIEKSMRWLGFVQGVMFANGRMTVEELKEHSRP